jgi:hypothetical protein
MKKYVQVPTSNDNNIKTLKISIQDIPGIGGNYDTLHKKITLSAFSDNNPEYKRNAMHEFDHFSSNIDHTHTNQKPMTGAYNVHINPTSNPTSYETYIKFQTSLFSDTGEYYPGTTSKKEILHDIYGENYPTNYHDLINRNNTTPFLMERLIKEYPDVPELKNEIFNYITPVQLAKLQKIYGVNKNSPVNAIEMIQKYPNLVLEDHPYLEKDVSINIRDVFHTLFDIMLVISIPISLHTLYNCCRDRFAERENNIENGDLEIQM